MDFENRIVIFRGGCKNGFMSDIGSILGSPQLPWLVLIGIVGALYAIQLVKSGYVQVHTDKVRIGRKASVKEQVILRRQVEYLRSACEATFRDIPRHEKFDEWRTKYVIELVIDEITDWCIFNHLDLNKSFVETKSDKIWYIVQLNTWNDLYKSEEFKRYVYGFVKRTIEKLYQIRQECEAKEYD